MSIDTLVLGGGIVGTSIALHLQKRGRSVVLADRRAPGEETSFGNAGLVERSSLHPVAFPRNISTLLKVATGRYPGANFHWSALPALAPWLFAYWRASAPARLEETARLMHQAMAATIDEHRALAREADAEGYFREGGWLKVYRSDEGLEGERQEFALAREFGLTAQELSQAEALALEPHLQPVFRHGVFWSDPRSVSNPGAVTKAYAGAFERGGGTVTIADARTLAQTGKGWRITGPNGAIEARSAVIALGAWSLDVLAPLGYRLPLIAKRGYHMHYSSRGNATLTRPVLDEEGGYVITPMERGIRLTTGAEFARRDAPKTPVQVDKTEAIARTLYPLAERVDPEPWMGNRPILPDSRPVIGEAPRHKGLWFAFGHQHLGFTLGPVTGRLLAEMMTGQAPFIDPAPFSPGRF